MNVSSQRKRFTQGRRVSRVHSWNLGSAAFPSLKPRDSTTKNTPTLRQHHMHQSSQDQHIGAIQDPVSDGF